MQTATKPAPPKRNPNDPPPTFADPLPKGARRCPCHRFWPPGCGRVIPAEKVAEIDAAAPMGPQSVRRAK